MTPPRRSAPPRRSIPSRWVPAAGWACAGLSLVANVTALALLMTVNEGAAPVPPLFSSRSGDITPALATLGSTAVGVIAILGGVLASRRPRNPIGWFFLGCAVFGAGYYFTAQYAVTALVMRPGPLPGGVVAAWSAQWLWLLAFACIVYLLLLFPDGRLPSRRWRPVSWLIGGTLTALTLLLALAPGQVGAFPVDNPLGVALLDGMDARANESVAWLWVGLPAVALVGLVGRYRRGGVTERQQLKYLLVAAVFMAAAVTIHQAELLPDPVGYVPVFAAATSLPVGVALAILRYGLYDIDRLVSRTVSYGLLTVLLVLVYLAAVFGLQRVLRPFAGDSQLAVAGATLAVAAAFRPLRRRLQSSVDRRFNRARYDAERTVQQFRARLRDAVGLEQLDAELLGAVRQTVQPVRVSLWLRPPATRHEATATRHEATDTRKKVSA